MQPPPTPPPPPNTHPQGERRAVIDIGSNSVKLLVANIRGPVVDPLLETGSQTRLGEGFFQSRRLQPAAIERTAHAVAAFIADSRRFNPARLRVIATAAAREALNQAEFLDTVRAVAQTEVEIIPGPVEADLAFRGVCTFPDLAAASLLVADVGGGSTELILGTAGHRRLAHSFPLGAVRLMEDLRITADPDPSDLPRCRAHLDAWIEQHVLPAMGPSWPGPEGVHPVFVGVGGTASVLACMTLALADYDRARIDATRLERTRLEEWTERLWALPLADRRRIPGLPPERADVILTGAAIYEALLRAFDLPAVRPSTRGLRFAALLDP